MESTDEGHVAREDGDLNHHHVQTAKELLSVSQPNLKASII